jgi:hypothetical protein
MRIASYFGGKKTALSCVYLSSFTLAVVLSCASAAHGSDLPEAPESFHPELFRSQVMTPSNLLLAGGLVASRALDWASTEECLRRSWCHEGELPNALVRSKPGLAAFEVSVSALSIFAQHEIGKHGHRKVAFMGQVVASSLIVGQDAYNYYVDKSYPRRP